ncbi:LysR family transcriptional regulator [Vibrio breoganii]|uniref:LysR family transcriptional regulator n=1 Tax=Vibrio breoganii TaxID=553239 RepID=A0ABX1UCY5_9VIBR|nr:LysR family transcriptional regulator [Vibrio breoganii]NMO75136.1 LysR family transcriptional regulator [Vibrio breoganii]NMR71650.1 LysR family transcriptional regulator [Vibrio breoganii]PMG02866.1 hypothetical protein BCV02_10185 [Vibrio breoganii]PMG96745.1 hypothetical protein BCU79_06495 [Vibrio breoganii]PML90364.1 hypothetical protein BCT67_05940 [Vibrio breoganii]
MDYSLAQLEAFVVTVETGSFKAAAIKLNKRSQAVAKLVALMEDSCNLTLFERHVRRLVLSSDGKRIYQFAKRIMRDTMQLDAMLSSIDQQLPSHFTIAIDSAIACPEVTQCYQEVIKQIPTLKLEVITGGTNEISDLVKNGNAEMALRFYPFSEVEGLTSVTVLNFAMVTIAAPQLINHGAVISDHELAQLTQIVPKFVYQYGFENPHVLSDKSIISNNMSSSLSMLCAGMGWMIVPDFIAKPYLDNGDLVEFSIEGAVQMGWMAEVIYPNEELLSMAGDIFLQQALLLQDSLSKR